MEIIKVKTELRHRFGKRLNIRGRDFNVNSIGEMEIPEEFVPFALKEGFSLSDPKVKFKSEESQNKSAELNILFENAKKQAEQIISDARKEAEKIISEARSKAGIILKDAQVDEREEAKKALTEKTVKELQEMALTGGITESEFKSLKKDELIDLILSKSF